MVMFHSCVNVYQKEVRGFDYPLVTGDDNDPIDESPWPLIVSFAKKNVIFYSYVNVYQRVDLKTEVFTFTRFLQMGETCLPSTISILR